jgi:hypothetical protein
MGSFLVGLSLVINVSHALEQGVVVPFDCADPAIVSVKLASTDLTETVKVGLRLVMLVDKLAQPAGGFADFHGVIAGTGVVVDFFGVAWILETEHVDVGRSGSRGRHSGLSK